MAVLRRHWFGMAQCSDACFYLTKHVRSHSTSRVKEKMSCDLCVLKQPNTDFPYNSFLWESPGSIIWELGCLWFCDIRRASSNRYEPLGSLSSLMIWHEKAKRGLWRRTQTPKGEIFKCESHRGSADEHDIGWSDLRGRHNDMVPYWAFAAPGLSLLFTVKTSHLKYHSCAKTNEKKPCKQGWDTQLCC